MGNSSGEVGEGARGCRGGGGGVVMEGGGVGSYGRRSRGGVDTQTDRRTERWRRGQTMKKTSRVEEDCGGEQVNSMAAGFM